MQRIVRLAVTLALSLPAALAVAAHPAETRVRAAEDAVRRDPEASRLQAEAALKLLHRDPDRELELRARFVLCDYHADQNASIAREHAAAGMALAERSPRAGWRAAFTLCRAAALATESRHTEARKTFDRAVALAEGAQDADILANALYQRGYLQGLAGRYVDGLTDLRRAHALYEKLGQPQMKRTVVNGIATLYNRMGDFAQAQEYYAQSVAQLERENIPRDLGIALHNLARVRENLGQWDAAERDFARALAAHEKIQYRRGIAYAQRGLASVANHRGEPEAALTALARAQAAAAGLEDARLTAQIRLQRGIAFRHLKRFAESATEIRAAVATFDAARSLFELRDARAALAATHAAAGAWREAFLEHAAYKAVSDSLFAGQLDQRFSWLKVEFDTAAKEQQNALLLREKAATERALNEERRANGLFAAVIVLIVALAGVLAWLVRHLQHEHRRVHALAMTDELTGLPNRRDALQRLSGWLTRDGDRMCAVLIADLDHFKPINDQHGHLVGDEILKSVADALRNAVREPAILGRLGGEEFAIFLPETGGEAARQAAERIRADIAAIDATRWFADRTITVSIGLTLARRGTDSVSSALRRADDALYRAKAAGRNRVEVLLGDDPAAATPPEQPPGLQSPGQPPGGAPEERT